MASLGERPSGRAVGTRARTARRRENTPHFLKLRPTSRPPLSFITARRAQHGRGGTARTRTLAVATSDVLPSVETCYDETCGCSWRRHYVRSPRVAPTA